MEESNDSNMFLKMTTMTSNASNHENKEIGTRQPACNLPSCVPANILFVSVSSSNSNSHEAARQGPRRDSTESMLATQSIGNRPSSSRGTASGTSSKVNLHASQAHCRVIEIMR